MRESAVTRRRSIGFSLSVSALLAIAALAWQTGGTAAASLQITPSADAYVSADYPTANYGPSANLRIDGSPVLVTYLRFDLRSVAGTVSAASLQLYANSASNIGYEVRTTSGSAWTESTVTYANAPVAGSIVGTSAIFAAASTTSVNVTPGVRAGSVVDLAVVARNTTAVSLASRESAHPPLLVLTMAATPSPTAPAPTAPAATPTPVSTPTTTPTASPTSAPTATPTAPSADPVLIGAGDICITSSIQNAYATANLILAQPNARVFTAGDNSNESGTATQYASCVSKAWGQFRDRTHPAPGNHDYLTTGAQPYYDYYGPLAGPAGKGWYSYDLANDWHVIVLNALCSNVGGCGAGSPEELWLRADLAASAGKHIIAVWHIPEFSSGGAHGNTTAYSAWWNDLYAAHADIVLNGHDHDYERFALQSPSGAADPAGIREFVVGTGGAGQRAFGTIRANSEVRQYGTFGVLKLTLHAHSYDWEFVPVAGKTFTDSGTTATHS